MNYSTLSLSELKALAIENNVIPAGNKRFKQTWIDALELFAASETISDLSDSQMECAAVAADMAKEIIDRLEELSIEPDNETEAEFEARSGEYIGLSEVLGDIQTEIKAQSNKKGAVAIFVAVAVAVAVVFTSLTEITAATIRACIHLTKMFGGYNPDYDLFYQLTQRLAVPAKQTQQPA
jgi:hypothetical protein